MQFEFATATRIVFGAGSLRNVGAISKPFGRRALVVTGRLVERSKPLIRALKSEQIKCVNFTVAGEPTIDDARRGAEQARKEHCDFVISFGGGSVIDAGKAIAALMTNIGDPLDYVEVIGRGKPITQAAAPFIAIPTTAGTGAEVTRNAVLGSPKHRVKVSLRSPLLLPRVALVDPELTYNLPRVLTASTGLDALTQLIEPYVSCKANPLTDAICIEGIRRAARSLQRACEQSDDAAAREDMALASLFGGLALVNSGLGAVHGFAAPIGGMFPAPHGAVCAALLPHVMAVNLRALQQRRPGSETMHRYDQVAQILTGNPRATAEDGVAWAGELCIVLRIPPLSAYGVKQKDFSTLIEKAAAASSMKGNPIALNHDELREILSRAIGSDTSPTAAAKRKQSRR